MTNPMSAPDVLEREYLQMRAKILELGAALDRLDRASGSVDTDPRCDLIRQGIETLLEPGDARAATIQTIFSRPYHADWRATLLGD